MIHRISDENILDISLSAWGHSLDCNSMDMYSKTSKYLLNRMQRVPFLCQRWLFLLAQQIGLWEKETFKMLKAWLAAWSSWRDGPCWWTQQGVVMFSQPLKNVVDRWSLKLSLVSVALCKAYNLCYFSQNRNFHALQTTAYICIVESWAVDAFLVDSLNETACKF